MNLHTPLTKGNRSLKLYASRLEKLGILTVQDFLFHLPSRYEDFSIVSKIGEIQAGETVTIQGEVVDIKNQYLRGARIKTIQKAIVMDDTGTIELTWFNQPFLIRGIPKDSTISASGRVERSARTLSMKGAQFEVLYSDAAKPVHTGRLIPVYPETKGVSSKWLRRQIHNIIEELQDELAEYLPETIVTKNKFMGLKEAIQEVHFPQSFETATKARDRLAFDELFLMQLSADKRRAEWKHQQTGHLFKIQESQTLIEKFIASLPFQLTQAQRSAVDDILHDFAKGKPMNRLLQGDVGSGKTIVGATAMYATYLSGYQSILMAPTEILAEQHYTGIAKVLNPLGVKIDLITGTKKPRIMNQESRIKGEPKGKNDSSFIIPDSHIIIGTHAVLNEKLQFPNLGLVIIDEQQRFGVAQRGLIRQKGNNPHLLTMTATPIPRTVALTMYGDLDLSYLDEMPHGRKRIKTWLVSPEKRDSAYDWIRKEITETQSQVFIVCPFIEPSETMQTIKAVNHEYERLSREVYPELKLGLLHGKLKPKEKEDVLQKFREKKFDILVATPVVEVGIDIPNATIIMIEAADRFGLAQLHQLRGRVGRGDKQSYCLLFADNSNGHTTSRLKAMETMYSGAALAEFDLKLRGPGNLYGTAQHGVPKLKVATFSDPNLIQQAKRAADEIFPHLASYPVLQEKLDEVTIQQISPD